MANEGTYDVMVSNIPGGDPNTSGSTIVDITESPTAPVSATADPPVVCADFTGTIKLRAIGGNGRYLIWYTGSCNDDQEGIGVEINIPAPPVTTTYYALWTSDDCGISGCASVTITVYDPPTPASAGEDQSVCSILSANLHANTPMVGSGQWSFVSGPGSVSFTDPYDPDSQVSVSVMGIYNLRWTISSGGICAPSSDEVSVEFGDELTVVASSNSPVCEGEDIILVSNNISGAVYNWTGPGGFTSDLQNLVITNASVSESGDYSVTVSGFPGGCPATSATIPVSVVGLPAVPEVNSQNINGSKQDVCQGSTITYAIASPVSGSVYTWNLLGGGTIIPSGSTDIIEILWSEYGGNYDLTVSETNVSGCEGAPATLNVILNPVFETEITIEADNNPVCAGTAMQIKATVTGGGTAPVLTWTCNGISLGGNDSVLIIENPSNHDIITCQATSSGICTYPAIAVSNAIELSVEPCVTVLISIPNAFSPNSDGVNDRFTIACSHPEFLAGYEIIIYNRWGQHIYTGNDRGEGWDGTLEGNPCPQDAYCYMITYLVTEPLNESKRIAGTVVLVR
jgi:gliding motility-associated-like protein